MRRSRLGWRVSIQSGSVTRLGFLLCLRTMRKLAIRSPSCQKLPLYATELELLSEMKLLCSPRFVGCNHGRIEYIYYSRLLTSPCLPPNHPTYSSLPSRSSTYLDSRLGGFGAL